MSEVHPGSFVGDSVEEFKKLPTWGKFAAGGVVLAVVGIAIYEKTKASSASNTGLAGPGATGASLDPNAMMGGVQSPYSQVPTTAGQGASVPVIPSGVNPLFDQLGNLIGWQQPTPPPAIVPPGPSPTSPPPASNSYVNLLGKIPNGSKINPGGIDANGQRFWYGTNSFFYAPVGSSVAQGGNGRLWLNLPNKPSNQQGVLITHA